MVQVYRLLFIGTIFVGVSSDDASRNFQVGARDAMLATTGVDLRSIESRWKFVFAAEINKPEKAQYHVRDSSAPYGVSMNVLIRGRFRLALCTCCRGPKFFYYNFWSHQVFSIQ